MTAFPKPKPYAETDFHLEELRRRDWTGLVASWVHLPTSALADEALVEAVRENALHDLEERRKAVFGYPLGPVELMVSDQHGGDWLLFPRNLSVLLAELRVLHLLHPPAIFPELVPFPRLLSAERRARRAVDVARGRLRRSWRSLRGEEVDP